MFQILDDFGRKDTLIALVVIWGFFFLFIILTVASPAIFILWWGLDKYRGRSGWKSQTNNNAANLNKL